MYIVSGWNLCWQCQSFTLKSGNLKKILPCLKFGLDALMPWSLASRPKKKEQTNSTCSDKAILKF